jgi:hypothetical protein
MAMNIQRVRYRSMTERRGADAIKNELYLERKIRKGRQI